jgi:hypothetical protein
MTRGTAEEPVADRADKRARKDKLRQWRAQQRTAATLPADAILNLLHGNYLDGPSSLQLWPDGRAEYAFHTRDRMTEPDGREFVQSTQRLARLRLAAEDVARIVDFFPRLEQLDACYVEPGIHDGDHTRVTFRHNGRTTTVTCNNKWPGEVLELLDLCRSIVGRFEAELNAAGEVP